MAPRGGLLPRTAVVGTPLLAAAATPHGFAVGSSITVAITGVNGHSAANGQFRATITGANTFTLDGTSPTAAANGVNGTWTTVPLIHTEKQGVKNFSIVADPDSPDLVYVGGDSPPSAWLVNAATNTFTPISGPGSTLPNDTTPHPDNRTLASLNHNPLVKTDDAGAYRLTTPPHH